MRLADQLLTESGGPHDIGGLYSKTCAAIREAERFELSDDVALAAYNLTKSKPTTLIGALPLCRAPYRKMWLEWRGGLTTDMVRADRKRDPALAPDPLKQGCLIETDASGQRGTMTFAWVHKTNPDRVGESFYTPLNIAPLGILFNWDEGADVREDGWSKLLARHPTDADKASVTGIIERLLFDRYTRPKSEDELKRWMEESVFREWGKFAGVPKERKALQEIEKHAMRWIVPHAHDFYRWCTQSLKSEQHFANFMQEIVYKSWEPDIDGEGSMIDTVVAMINSRNAIEHRDVDLRALNKARAKRRRPLFLEYRTTHLRLSQAQQRAFRAGLLSRADAGLHRVRGHFKIRKTGIYWWSPFFRGDAARPVKRAEYEID